jgi:hypothetical protein
MYIIISNPKVWVYKSKFFHLENHLLRYSQQPSEKYIYVRFLIILTQILIAMFLIHAHNKSMLAISQRT